MGVTALVHSNLSEGDLERGGKRDNLSVMIIFMAAMLDGLKQGRGERAAKVRGQN